MRQSGLALCGIWPIRTHLLRMHAELAAGCAPPPAVTVTDAGSAMRTCRLKARRQRRRAIAKTTAAPRTALVVPLTESSEKTMRPWSAAGDSLLRRLSPGLRSYGGGGGFGDGGMDKTLIGGGFGGKMNLGAMSGAGAQIRPCPGIGDGERFSGGGEGGGGGLGFGDGGGGIGGVGRGGGGGSGGFGDGLDNKRKTSRLVGSRNRTAAWLCACGCARAD